ncbi:MAG: hypothetical protein LBR15_06380 [Methanobrevibacter sp.]|jgi:hypothetical protein|nr:hypothetical protein [Candidatus Methanovirga australis]
MEQIEESLGYRLYNDNELFRRDGILDSAHIINTLHINFSIFYTSITTYINLNSEEVQNYFREYLKENGFVLKLILIKYGEKLDRVSLCSMNQLVEDFKTLLSLI